MPGAPNGRLRRLAAALRGAGPAIAADAAVSEAEKLKNTERQWNEMFGSEEAAAEGDFFTSPDQGKVDGPCALPPLSSV